MTPSPSKGLLKDTVLYSMGQILPRMIAFLLLPILSRYLTAEDYGALGMLAILSLVATSIATLGLNWSLAKGYFSTNDRSVRDGLIWSSFLTIMAYNAALFLAVYLGRETLSYLLLGKPEYGLLVVVAFLSVSLSGLLIPFTSYLKFEQKAGTVVLLAVFEVLSSSFLTLYFVIGKGLGPLGPLLGQLFAQALLLPLFLAIALARVQLTLSFGTEFRASLAAGLPFMMSFVGSFLLQSGTRLSLVETRGFEEGGIFFVSQNCSKILELLVMGMMTAWFPAIARIIQNDQETVQAVRKMTRAYLTIISIPVAAACFFAKPLMTVLVPSPLSEGWRAIGLLTLAQAVYGFYAIHQPLFVLKKKSVWQVSLEAIFGVVALFMAYPLSYFLGFVGAAAAQFLACLFLSSGAVVFLRRRLHLQYETGRLFKVLTALCFVFVLSLFQPDYLPYQFFNAFIGVILYLIYLWHRILETDEKEQVKNMMARFVTREA
ncbi:lipopolysaccharide biosynthesis protein [Estrella lausannensis]|uniref:Putative polysaccharide biosynthesis protein n=1 Tax=Estrella lausannensis TaxID=483423 RepID=A0A0H5DQG1_9BACT|nr:lipopolysaccharide biosynthesis protein [Estrella lausannensis]CRX38762.1 Putative polysaccharide biosynthesis protein [Estrella lausannensis]